MKTHSHLPFRRTPHHLLWSSAWGQALLWALLTVTALLLVGFTAVVQDITQRGELPRLQQQVSSALTLPEELQALGVEGWRMLSIPDEKLAGS